MTRRPDFTNPTVTQRRVAYDTDNMPTQVWAQQSGVTTYFSYDGDGDRVKKTTTGGSTIYYVGEHYEVKNDESLKYIFAGNLRLIMIKGSNTFYYHKDHLNSTSVMTDNSGAVVETAQYEPFGATRDHTGQDMSGYKFTDQELDNETNLYNYDARLYDPVIGRFGTADSIIQDWYDPQTINAYSYCRNNPLIYTDPSGFIPSLEEALEMANHVYKGKKGDSLSGGWEMVNAFTLSKSCYIGLYYRELQDGSNEFAIVNRGTHAIFSLQMGDNLTNLVQPFGLSDDMIQNIAQPFGLSKDMKLSIEFARNFAKTNSGAETTYVGHSKGGAESAGMAVATNGNAILVNPATINLKAYGLDSSQYSGNMTACIVVGEVLNKAFGPISKPIGKVRYLSLPDKNLIQKHYSKSALEAFLSEN